MKDQDRTKDEVLDELRQSEQRFRALSEASFEAIAISRHGRLLDINAAFERMFGYDRAELVGLDILSLVAPEHRAAVMAKILSEYDKPYEVRTVRKDGSLMEVEVCGKIATWEGRRCRITALRDITERRREADRLKESEERYRALFEQAVESIVVIDAETGLFISFNDRAHESLGYTREEFDNLEIADFEIIESPEEVVLHLAKIAREGADSFETKHRTKQGEIRDVHVRSKALSIGERSVIQSTWYDITERKRNEQALKFLVRELDHRVKNTLATVDSVAEQTLRSSASLADFGEAFQGRIRALARFHEAGAEKSWGPLQLRQLVDLAVAPLGCDGRHISIEGDGVLITPSSVRVIGMALYELATNAAKHGALSKPGGHVAISWQVESTSGRNWLRIIWVESGGPAVAKPTRRSLGTILIEEAIAHELGGNVKLEFPPTGVRCEIGIPLASDAEEIQGGANQLPFEPDVETIPGKRHEPPKSLHGVKAIIVEDNLTLVRSLSFLLESYGCEVTGVAGTTEEALKLVGETAFDVAILDIELGGTTVAPVADRIRQQGGRIVYLTGYGNLEMLPYELREFPHLGKPVDSDLLLSTILGAVGR